MRKIACILVAGLCLAAACGDDDDSSDDSSSDKFVDAISTSIQESDARPSFTNTEANCVAQAIVDSVGVKALDDAGVTPEQLKDAEDLASLDVEIPADAADKLADGLDDCHATGVVENQLVHSSLEALGVSVTAPSVDCVTTEMDDDDVRTAWAELALDSSGDTTAIQEAVTSAFAACPGTLTEVALGGESLAAAYGGELPEDDESMACIGTYIEENAADVAAAVVGGDDSEAMAAIAAACPAPAAPVEPPPA